MLRLKKSGRGHSFCSVTFAGNDNSGWGARPTQFQQRSAPSKFLRGASKNDDSPIGGWIFRGAFAGAIAWTGEVGDNLLVGPKVGHYRGLG